MKQKMIEEKLEKLGVEKGSGSSAPNIHAPHARAASVSTDEIKYLSQRGNILSYRFRPLRILHYCFSS